MSTRVFISYSAIDEEYANAIAAVLAELKISYFLDKKDIRWGDEITGTIGKGLAHSSELILILSPASVKSAWVSFEIGQAVALGKRVLPFLTHAKLDVPSYLANFHYKTNIADIRAYFETAKLDANDSAIELPELADTYHVNELAVTLGEILNLVGDELAAGIPLALSEVQFLGKLGFRFRGGNHYEAHFDAEKLYVRCFEELWGWPSMSHLIGRLIILGLVRRPPEFGSFLLTDKGLQVINQLRAQTRSGSHDTWARVTTAIANVVPILTVSTVLMPEKFKPSMQIDLQVTDTRRLISQIQAMCVSEGLAYRGHHMAGGFIAKRSSDNKYVFMDVRAQRVSQPFDQVLDDVVHNDDSGTYYLRIRIDGRDGAVHYATANLSLFSSDLEGTTAIWGFCLETRDRIPIMINEIPKNSSAGGDLNSTGTGAA